MSQPNLWSRINDAFQSRRGYRVFGTLFIALGVANLVKFFSGHSRTFGLEPFNGIVNTILGLLFVFGKHPRPPAGPIALNLNVPREKPGDSEKIGA